MPNTGFTCRKGVASDVVNDNNNRVNLNLDTFSGIFGFHNINGIKSDTARFRSIVEWNKNRNIDVMGLAETNINKTCGLHYNNLISDLKYKGIWSECANKVKGSGVALLINDIWAKRLGKIDSPSPYILNALFYFKGVTFTIIVIYFPPSDKRIQKDILEYCKSYLKKEDKTKNSTNHMIFLGDFNSVRYGR